VQKEKSVIKGVEWDVKRFFSSLDLISIRHQRFFLIGVRFDEQGFIGSKTRNGSGHVFCL